MATTFETIIDKFLDENDMTNKNIFVFRNQ